MSDFILVYYHREFVLINSITNMIAAQKYKDISLLSDLCSNPATYCCLNEIK